MRKISLTFLIFFLIIQSSQAQIEKMPYDINGNSWFENIKIGGYVQARYNRLLETNPDLACNQCGKSWGTGNGISLRRVRLKFSGNLGEHVYFYI